MLEHCGLQLTTSEDWIWTLIICYLECLVKVQKWAQWLWIQYWSQKVIWQRRNYAHYENKHMDIQKRFLNAVKGHLLLILFSKLDKHIDTLLYKQDIGHCWGFGWWKCEVLFLIYVKTKWSISFFLYCDGLGFLIYNFSYGFALLVYIFCSVYTVYVIRRLNVFWCLIIIFFFTFGGVSLMLFCIMIFIQNGVTVYLFIFGFVR